MSIAVGVVDDHPLVVGGLGAALSSIDDIRVAAQGGTVAEARHILGRRDIDGSPGGRTLAAHRTRPGVRVCP